MIDEIRSETYSRNSTGKPLSDKGLVKRLCKNIIIKPEEDAIHKQTTEMKIEEKKAEINLPKTKPSN